MSDKECMSSPAKVTGIVEQQAIVWIGETKRILFCDEELRSQLEELIPTHGTIEYTSDTLLSFRQMND